VIGLGYVGLPLAVALAKQFETFGLDVDAQRIAELETGHDRTGEIDADNMQASSLSLTCDPDNCPPCDFYIITVPTPIDGNNRPDLRKVEAASRTVGAMIAKSVEDGRTPIAIYESTVYPGVTEDICAPILEQVSGLRSGTDFFLGYSPELINPGDRKHTIDKITKVVSGQTPEVLEAARTKWNFLPFSPGLVGGHCIGVDLYYLSHHARELGHEPKVVLAGRGMNDGVAHWVAENLHDVRGATAGTSCRCWALRLRRTCPICATAKWPIWSPG
jgi:UDP-N-acetyl-D-mannosaminuronate dehydrogenase